MSESMSEFESKKRALENESNEIALALSCKRKSLDDPTTPSDPAEDIILKALIPNTMAGVLIGKEGSTIKSMTETSGAKIRVSASKVFYPGTNERLVLILGTRDDIVNAVEQIAAKLAEFISADKKEEPSAEKPADEGFEMKLLIPKAASGYMIGKSGSTIKAITEVTACKLQLVDEDASMTHERVMIINSRTAPALVVGAATVALHLLNDERARVYTNATIVYTAPATAASALGGTGMVNPYGSASMQGGMGFFNSMGGQQQMYPYAQSYSMDAPVSSSNSAEDIVLKALVPNAMAGVLIGKQGSTVKSMSETSGAKIRVSGNEVFWPGTNERLVLLSGTRDAIVNAVEQITAKVAESISHAVAKKEKEEPSAEKAAPGFEMKLLIPKAASGYMLGKSGSAIKTMTEVSACKLQLGTDEDTAMTNERVMIINSRTAPALVVGAATVALHLLSDERVRIYTNPTIVYTSAAGATE